MKRTNTFEVRPLSDTDERLLFDVLDAAASLWNAQNYVRRQQFFDGGSVWDAETVHHDYKGVLGSAAAKEMRLKNDEAWRSFFDSDEPDKGLPGYWGNEEDGRELRWVGRCDQYTLETGDRSRLEIPVGSDLKDEYDHTGRLRLEVRGEPQWDGKNCRLELQYDEQRDQFRAYQPVEVADTDSHLRLGTPLASEEAALDIGANNIVACTTSIGKQYLYEGRELFDRFRETTFDIAERQSTVKREEGQYSSRRIRKLYRKRTNRRNHAQNALVRDLIERLHNEDVSTVYVGALTNVLETHWSVKANAKTHNFWAFRQFVKRLTCTAEEYGLSVKARSEEWTSQECPYCGERNETVRHGDSLWCPCGFEGHADLVASETFLQRQTTIARPMARPVCLKWNDHTWSAMSHAHESSNEEHTNRNRSQERELASVGKGANARPRPPVRGIPRL
jgi:putative transposase